MKRAVVMVIDGLRADMVGEEFTPRLAEIVKRSRRFTDQRSVFPSATRVNSASIATGCWPKKLYDTFANQLAKLPDETLIYPGHDYIGNNLEFTLDREPDNEGAAQLLKRVTDQDPDDALVSTLALEKDINTFFRLRNPTVIARLRDAFPDLPDDPDAETVFLKLRELRNSW